MKLSKIFSLIFAVLGTGLMVLTVILSFWNRNAQPKLADLPEEARICSETLMEALAAGDYERVRSVIYGQPELGLSAQPEEDETALVWEAVKSSFAYEFVGDCYSEGRSIYRDAEVTFLNAAALSDALPELAQAILEQRKAADPEALYGQTGELLPQVRQEILREAVGQAIAGAEQETLPVRLQLVEENGRWWVIPDRSLFTALSGGIV